MTQLQKIVLLIGIGAASLACLLPPWVYSYDDPRPGATKVERFAGYGFIGTPPDLTNVEGLEALFALGKGGSAPQFFATRIDTERLVLGLMAIAGLTGIGCLLAKRNGEVR